MPGFLFVGQIWGKSHAIPRQPMPIASAGRIEECRRRPRGSRLLAIWLKFLEHNGRVFGKVLGIFGHRCFAILKVGPGIPIAMNRCPVLHGKGASVRYPACLL